MTSKYDDLLAKQNASILLLYKVCEEKIVRMLFYFVIFLLKINCTHKSERSLSCFSGIHYKT